MVIGILRSKGFFLPRHRVRDFIGDHDPVSVLLHWTQATVLRKYSVAGPNALLHIDGLHKLIRWGFVVHGSMWISSIMCYHVLSLIVYRRASQMRRSVGASLCIHIPRNFNIF